MSNMFESPRSTDETRSLPQGETVGSYTSYLDAQKAVDYLADQQFPVQLVSIVGNELKMVERVTGRLSYPRVALNGALSGMWFGLFVGMLLSFFSPSGGAFSIITSVLMGAAFFMLFGIVTYAMQRGKRDFTSTSQVVASSYDVVVAREVAMDARRLLQQLPIGQGAAKQGWGQPTGVPPTGAQPWQDPRNQGGQYGQSGQYNQGGQYGQGGQQGQGGHYGQPDPQAQPWQPPQQQPQQPSGWNDPYGAASAPQEQEGANQYGAHQGEASSPEPAEPSPVRSRYPDLPDGRPQYGVRVEEEAAPEASVPQAAPAPAPATPGTEPRADATSDSVVPDSPVSDGPVADGTVPDGPVADGTVPDAEERKVEDPRQG